MNYLLHLLVYFDIFLIVAWSLNLVVGYAGQLTLAHAGYYAVGGYAYAILSLKFDLDFLLATLIGVVLSSVLSLAVSLCSWRLRGDFFVLASLAVQALIFSALLNWTHPQSPIGTWANLTNGPFGIAGIARPRVFGISITTLPGMAVLATIVAAACGGIIYRLGSSPWGRLVIAMRDDDLAVRALGKSTRLVKVQAFAISTALAAVAGSLYAAHVRYVDPSIASLDESILMLSMVIVGGLGNFRGPIVGTAILLLIPEVLRFLELPAAQAANVRLMIYGGLLVGMMLFRPQGLAGEYRIQ